LGKNLREVFFGMLHHHEETIPVFEAAAADFEDAKQMGMSELFYAAPESELQIGGGTSGNKFDRGFLRLRIGELREENGGVFRTRQVPPQPESIVDDLTFALFPEIAHSAPPTENSRELADGDTSSCVARNRRKNTAATRAGLERLDLRFAGAWGRALVGYILA